MKRARVWVLGIAAAHLLIHGAVLLLAAEQSARRYDTAVAPGVGERILEAGAFILSLPLLPWMSPTWFPGLVGYLPIAVNSLCWGLAGWLLLRWIDGRRLR
ncbi:MAG: hypothetical protein HKP27_03365 [Myxococcales bacterium]|nr:hypothetical protein [Myxococcales bacterium]